MFVYEINLKGNIYSINIMELEIKLKKDTNIELVGSSKYKPEELTADGLPTIETQLKELKMKDDEQLPRYENDEALFRREMTQRVKCLALHKLGMSIFTNTYELNPRVRIKLQDVMWTYNDVEFPKIIEEFNNMVTEELFENDKIDISKLPIYEFK